MKRPLSVFLALLALSCAGAQDVYFGLRVDVVGPPNLSPVVPLPGFQLGGPVLGDVELRASLHTFLLVNFVQVHVLYTQDLSDALRGYGGVGVTWGPSLSMTTGRFSTFTRPPGSSTSWEAASVCSARCNRSTSYMPRRIS